MANYGVYVSWQELKEYLEIDSGITDYDQQLKSFTAGASRLIDNFTQRKFYPTLETRYFDHPDNGTYTPVVRSSGQGYLLRQASNLTGYIADMLPLRDDLLEVVTFTTNNGGTTVSSADYYLMTGNRYDMPPYDRIVMKSSGNQPSLTYTGTIQRANAITGYWGYHEDWNGAWLDSGDNVQDNPLSSSATTITVGNADGLDTDRYLPRFREQQLIKIDSEYIFVTNVNTGLETLTVIRGVNGTTAASHNQAAKIYVYQPHEEIQTAIKVWGGWLYHLKNSQFGLAMNAQLGQRELAGLITNDVSQVINHYHRIII